MVTGVQTCALPILLRLYLLTYVAIRQTGQTIPALSVSFAPLAGAFVMFFIAAVAEELGYAVYATESLQRRFTPLVTALIIGVPWALWHLPSMIGSRGVVRARKSVMLAVSGPTPSRDVRAPAPPSRT